MNVRVNLRFLYLHARTHSQHRSPFSFIDSSYSFPTALLFTSSTPRALFPSHFFPSLPLPSPTFSPPLQLDPPRRPKMPPLHLHHLQPALLDQLPDVSVPPTTMPLRMHTRGAIQQRVHPPVITPSVLQQQHPASVGIRQIAQPRQQGRRLRCRA